MDTAAPSAPSDRPGPTTLGFRTFGEYSQFLRAAMADEESLQLSEGLHLIANEIEHVATVLREPQNDRTAIARSLVALLDLLRDYRHLVQEMSEDWHASYEFKAHFLALTQFRSLVTRWASEAGPPRYRPPEGAEFELAAWRLLGAGALLMDAFEQTGPKVVEGDSDTETAAKEPGWWGSLLTVLHLKP